VLLWALLPVPQARAFSSITVDGLAAWNGLSIETFNDGFDTNIIIDTDIAATETVTINVTGNGRLTLRGTGGMKTISRAPGLGAFALVKIIGNATDVIIDDLTFIGGDSDADNGGALSVEADTVTVTDCVFKDNSAGIGRAGGALYIMADGGTGTATVTNCEFEGNSTGGQGGALFIAGEAIIEECLFTENSSVAGGGALYVNDSTGTGKASLTDCDFEGNSTDGDGGAVCLDLEGTFTLCTFEGNEADGSGAAISQTSESDTTIDECTFKDNEGTTYGTVIDVKNKVLVKGVNYFVDNSPGGDLDYGIGSYNHRIYEKDIAEYLDMTDGEILTELPDPIDQTDTIKLPKQRDETRTKQSLPAQIHGFGRQGLTLRVGETVFLPKIQNASLAGFWASASKAGYVDLALTLDGLTIHALKPGIVQIVLENDAVYAVMDVTIVP
jgi:predicted outer membrane repeat protein